MALSLCRKRRGEGDYGKGYHTGRISDSELITEKVLFMLFNLEKMKEKIEIGLYIFYKSKINLNF